MLTLVAYYIGAEKSPDYFSAALVEKLNQYMIPNYFIYMTEFPLTINGKIDKKALPLPEEALRQFGEFVAPVGDLENLLATFWMEILGLSKIGRNISFFSVGGHSLRAIQLVSKIYKETGINLKISDIFTQKTIKDLALFISGQSKSEFRSIKPAAEKELYKLSAAQKRLYFLYEFDPLSIAYNISDVFYLGDNTDADKIELTLNKLVERHESLRTIFLKIGDEVFQKILPTLTIKLERSECNEADFANYLSEFARPFDLEHGPLLRSALVNLRNGKFAWLIDIHHIIADGTSYQTLMSDFSKLYAGEELEKPKLQYRDFSEWQNKLILSGDLDAQRAYWITQFEEKVPRLNLASDFQRPENFTFQGSSIELQFDKSTIDLLRVFTIKSGATLQTTLLAVLNVLFFKYTGQEDVAIGCGIAGRRHADVERIVGMFVNTLAIRSYPTGEMSFSSFIEQVTSNSILAYENQDVQFEDMVDVLKLERDPSRNPLFDICLVVQNFERLSFDRSVLTNSEGQRPETTRGIDLVNTTSKFDMTWFFYESNDSLLLHLEYYSAIFKQSTIERFAKQFNSILATVLNAPELTLSKINFLTQDEEKHVLENIVLGPKCHYEENLLHGSFEKACEMFPNAMAIVDEQGSFTFSELNTRANRLARFLKDGIGIKSEAPIGVLQKRGHNAIVSILAILKAGGTYVAIDYDYPEERILHILKEAQIEIILTQKSALGRTNRLAWRTSCTNHVVCVDSENAHVELDDHKNELMRKDLWDHVGETARDLISGGGWQNSFTGQYFSEAEMNEYAENTYSKLKPYLHKNMKVLEIGCASGITLLAIAPHVHQYVGIDLSSSIIANTEAMVKGMGYENVSFKCLPADEVNTLDGGYDLVIINSVIQCFNSHNYLRDVLSKAISKMKPTGFLFLGDLMDEDKREDLLTELNEFSQSTQKKHATKTDLSAELFISRKFLDDLISDNIGIIKAEYSDKIGTIQNELTRFRFDALLSVSKHDTVKQKLPRNKHQHDLQRISSYESTPLDLTIDGENLAYILFTSGTSGQPKGVLVKHCGVSNTILSYLDFLNIQHGEKVLQFASLSFDASIWEMFLSLSSGSTLYIPTDDQRQSPEELLDYVNHYGITFATLTPSYLKQMEISKLKTLKSLVSVGEQASYSTLAEFSLHGNAFNAYGPTESSICATAFQFVDEGESQKNIPIGNPATNGSVYILNEMNKLVSTGVVGEICIGGRGVARGYLNNKNLTEAKFIDNPYLKGETIYKTGDLGRWLPNGTIEFIGRKDDQVKIRGHRIELREIENVILKYGSINDTVVITLAAQGESSIVAYYVSDHEITATSLRSFMRTHLPTYMMPEHFVRIESLPISTNGKVNKRALPKPAGTQLSRDDRYVEARNEYESRLVKIWEAVLNTQRVGVLDDFFESGGHSLKATRLSSQIHKEFNVKVSIKELFANTTIEAQANTIQRIIWLNSEVKMENEMVI
jgi:amino acid adenylation domain-containing protein